MVIWPVVGWLVGCLVGLLVCLVPWMVLWLDGSLVDRLDVSRLVDCMFCPLVGWLVGG